MMLWFFFSCCWWYSKGTILFIYSCFSVSLRHIQRFRKSLFHSTRTYKIQEKKVMHFRPFPKAFAIRRNEHNLNISYGAGEVNRTPNLRVTSALLYHWATPADTEDTILLLKLFFRTRLLYHLFSFLYIIKKKILLKFQPNSTILKGYTFTTWQFWPSELCNRIVYPDTSQWQVCSPALPFAEYSPCSHML